MTTKIKVFNRNIQGTKKAVCSLSLILMLAMTLVMAFAQSGLAQVGVPQPVKTVGYISVAPTLVGVGQNATVNLWVFPMPTNYAYRPFFDGFRGVEVTFVRPDGTKDTFLPVDGTGQYDPGQMQSLGAIFFTYAPDMAGNWSVSFTMPAQNLTDSSGTVLYTGCNSRSFSFTVQTDPVLAGLLNGYPWSPLPNENAYWSYPINSNNREWSQISGDWLGSSINGGPINGVTCRLWQPYGSGPNTGHIVWSQPLKAGGIIGGEYGSVSYAQAIGGVSNTVIMDGKAFVNIPNTSTFECIDLTTGKLLYTASGQITGGIHIPGNPNAQSSLDSSVVLASSYGSSPTPYLYGTSGTTWNFYDPFTGTLMLTIANCSSAKLVDGTNLAFGVASGKLFAWDMSKVITTVAFGSTAVGPWNWSKGVQWASSLPATLLGTSPSLFGISTDVSTIVLKTPNQYWGYSAKDGTSLWNLTLTYPVSQNQQICLYGVDDFIVFDPVASSFHCYSMLTGNELWESPSMVTSSSPWASTWTVYSSETNDYNNLYLMLPDGTMTALSLATGKEVWRSEPIPSTEYTNNAVPFVQGMVMVGGNIYVYAGYSTGYQINPIPRQAMLVCVNATTGNITWKLNGGIDPSAAANGYVLGSGIYDGNLYCLGKGQTSTSVTIQNNVVTSHATALITGNVLDQSPASPNTPAVADSAMSEWMDYLHMQNATLLNNPPKPEGVPVTLTAVDPNGNTITIGTATTDSAGNYGINFVPTIEGMYTITATFEGTTSYWSSSAEAKLTVTEAPATSTPTSAAVGISETALYISITAIIVVILIVGAILGLLMLRKRP
jgi:outer membrane protein assembly factor BamB